MNGDKKYLKVLSYLNDMTLQWTLKEYTFKILDSLGKACLKLSLDKC